eukprot:gnl/MRDRNA2_/MRDRNA2_114157_c0_seq1.p1 gnl/MRDRNA2_/MRDRNA2_114157_c0~~gnl/MRDRNA2_/MRDRNA2_114157_c0_seq1.p1  ORF type:complete len:162 (+),score=26.46 gnl/MRDRNA2_/MRDRNA2_114157_c0_seq1:23-487(+)
MAASHRCKLSILPCIMRMIPSFVGILIFAVAVRAHDKCKSDKDQTCGTFSDCSNDQDPTGCCCCEAGQRPSCYYQTFAGYFCKCSSTQFLEAVTTDKAKCLAAMTKLCPDVKDKGDECRACLHAHIDVLQPLCEHTGSGKEYCGEAVDRESVVV